MNTVEWHAMLPAMSDDELQALRENTGTTGVVLAAQAAAVILAEHDIPHLVVGGLALQLSGYPRQTIDVDLVVPDVLEAIEMLTASLSGPFFRVKEAEDRIEHRPSGVPVDLLPAGRVVKQGCKVPFPVPTQASGTLQQISVEQLVALKLDSWANSPIKRLRDKSDVVELIQRRKLPRHLQLPEAVRPAYIELWDGLDRER